MGTLVSFGAVIRVVTQRFSEKRCVTTLITAAKETMGTRVVAQLFYNDYYRVLQMF